MLKIVENPTFARKVTVRVPVDDGYDEQAFRVRYRILSDEDEDGFDMRNPEDVKSFLRAAVADFSDVEIEGGAQMQFSPAALSRLIGVPYIRVAMVAAYYDGLIGAKTGN